MGANGVEGSERERDEALGDAKEESNWLVEEGEGKRGRVEEGWKDLICVGDNWSSIWGREWMGRLILDGMQDG